MYNDNRGEFMEGYSIIVLLFGVISLGLLIMVYFINRIFQYKTRIDNSFIAVKEGFLEQANIVSEIIEFLKNNLDHEKSYQKKLEQVKEIILSIENNSEGISKYRKIEKELFNFSKLEKTYNILDRNKEYKELCNKLERCKEKILYAFDSYDKGVISYNNYKENKLIEFLNKLCRIPEYDCYNK